MLTRMGKRTLLCALTLAVFVGPLPSAQQRTAPAAPAWPQWGGPNRNFMSDSKGLAVQVAGERAEEAVDPRARRGALGHRRRGRTALHHVPPARHCCAWCGAARRRSIAALDAGHGRDDLGAQIPVADRPASISREGAGPHSTPLVTGRPRLRDRQPERAVRAEQGDREGRVVARSDQGIRRHRPGPRLRVQPAPLQRHDHRQRRRPGPDPRRVQREDRRARVEGGRLQDVARVADPHRRRRPEAAALLRRRRDRRARSGERADAVDAIRTRPTGASTSARRSGRRPITCCSCRPRTAPAAASSSCARPAARRPRRRSGSATGCACTSARRSASATTSYGSSGDFGPAFLTAVEVTTGKIAWQDRAFARAQLALRRRQARDPGRGRHPGPRDRHARGPAGAGARRRCSRTSPGRRRRWSARSSTPATGRTSRASSSAHSRSAISHTAELRPEISRRT